MAAELVLSGPATWNPVSLGWLLTAPFGGCVWARRRHFVGMAALVALALGHVFVVLATDRYSIRPMSTSPVRTPSYIPIVTP